MTTLEEYGITEREYNEVQAAYNEEGN